jgi:hypothetical protein
MGKRKQQKAQNRLLEQAARAMSPEQVMAATRQYAPWLMGAIAGQPGRNPLQQQLFNLVSQPGYIDPALMQLPFAQVDLASQNALLRGAALTGRSGLAGGLAASLPVAVEAARGLGRADIAQRFALFREQQRRADLAQITDLYRGLLGQAAAGQAGAAQFLGARQAPTPFLSTLGSAATGFLGTLSGMPSQFWANNPQLTRFLFGSTAGGSTTGGTPATGSFLPVPGGLPIFLPR